MRDASEVIAALDWLVWLVGEKPEVITIRDHIASLESKLATLPASTPPGDAVAWACWSSAGLHRLCADESTARMQAFGREWHVIPLYTTPPQPASADVVEYEFEVFQGGAWQAGGSATTLAEATREAGHYAAMYAQDGPLVEVRYYERREVKGDSHAG